MPPVSFLDVIPLRIFFVITTIGLILAIESGFHIGAWRRKKASSEKDAPVGAVVAATLGLVGFILAMTFSFAVSRFERRQEAFLSELNAIGTCYLRADFLSEPQRKETKLALREYVDVRAKASEHQTIPQGIVLSEELHTKLWATLSSLAQNELNSLSVNLYIESLNELIDLHEQRLMAGLHLRIPKILWLVLFIISLLGMGEIGYHTGLTGSARTPASLGLAIAFALLLYLVADLDRPHEGSLRVNQSAMRELGQRFRSKSAP